MFSKKKALFRKLLSNSEDITFLDSSDHLLAPTGNLCITIVPLPLQLPLPCAITIVLLPLPLQLCHYVSATFWAFTETFQTWNNLHTSCKSHNKQKNENSRYRSVATSLDILVVIKVFSTNAPKFAQSLLLSIKASVRSPWTEKFWKIVTWCWLVHSCLDICLWVLTYVYACWHI